MKSLKQVLGWVWPLSPILLAFLFGKAIDWIAPDVSGGVVLLLVAVQLLVSFSPMWLPAAVRLHRRQPLYQYGNRRLAEMLEPEHWARVVEKIKSGRHVDVDVHVGEISIRVTACGLCLRLEEHWLFAFDSTIEFSGTSVTMSRANRKLFRKRVVESFGPYVPPQMLKPTELPKPTNEELIARAEAERGDC